MRVTRGLCTNARCGYDTYSIHGQHYNNLCTCCAEICQGCVPLVLCKRCQRLLTFANVCKQFRVERVVRRQRSQPMANSFLRCLPYVRIPQRTAHCALTLDKISRHSICPSYNLDWNQIKFLIHKITEVTAFWAVVGDRFIATKIIKMLTCGSEATIAGLKWRARKLDTVFGLKVGNTFCLNSISFFDCLRPRVGQALHAVKNAVSFVDHQNLNFINNNNNIWTYIAHVSTN